jgi:hypothetical protein
MPTMLIREGRNPYEVWTAVGIIVITAYAVLVGSPSASAQETLSHTQQIAWSALCFFGASVTLAGLFWRGDHMTGLLIERAGQVMLSGSLTIYLVSLCTVSSFDRAGVVMTIGCGCAISAAHRALKITRGVRQIRNRVGGLDG